MCSVLKEIYRKIYNDSFTYKELENRIKLQKAVYLLENMGVHVGDYSFSWNKYGPYSLKLDCDAQNCSVQEEKDIVFSSFAEQSFEKIREYLEEQVAYSCVQWIECIASLHYLKNVYRIKENSLINELEQRKPYLSNRADNEKALRIMSKVKVGA